MPTPRLQREQLDLFQPAPTRPRWWNLPPDVQSRVLELLTQLMQSHPPLPGRENVVAADRGQEAGHE